MALDPHQTFVELVNERSRLLADNETLTRERDEARAALHIVDELRKEQAIHLAHSVDDSGECWARCAACIVRDLLAPASDPEEE